MSETFFSNEILFPRKEVKQIIAFNFKQCKVLVRRLTENEINSEYCEIKFHFITNLILY